MFVANLFLGCKINVVQPSFKKKERKKKERKKKKEPKKKKERKKKERKKKKSTKRKRKKERKKKERNNYEKVDGRKKKNDGRKNELIKVTQRFKNDTLKIRQKHAPEKITKFAQRDKITSKMCTRNKLAECNTKSYTFLCHQHSTLHSP